MPAARATADTLASGSSDADTSRCFSADPASSPLNRGDDLETSVRHVTIPVNSHMTHTLRKSTRRPLTDGYHQFAEPIENRAHYASANAPYKSNPTYALFWSICWQSVGWITSQLQHFAIIRPDHQDRMNAKLVSPIIIFCGYNIVPKHIAEFVAPRHSLACDVSFM